MREGRIEQTGTYAEIYARPANLFAAQFINHYQGIPVTVHKEHFYDSKRKLVDGMVDGQIPVTLLVPVEAGEELTFVPTRWQLFEPGI